MKKKECLLIFSGGQDSTTCLFWALERYEKVHAVTFNYGQRHRIEIESAANVLRIARDNYKHVEITDEVVDVGPVLRGTSPLVSDATLEQYPTMHHLPGGLEKTFVPGRNLLFLTLAANIAYSKGITDVMTGVCQEDFGGYPDCRQVFIDAAQFAIREGFSYLDPQTGARDDFVNFTILTPLMNLSKAATCGLAYSMPVCWEAMAFTHTAYDGQFPPIGNDHATLLRAKGFLEAGLPDPLVIRAASMKLMALPDTSNYKGVKL